MGAVGSRRFRWSRPKLLTEAEKRRLVRQRNTVMDRKGSRECRIRPSRRKLQRPCALASVP
jgi:hypothetical protein